MAYWNRTKINNGSAEARKGRGRLQSSTKAKKALASFLALLMTVATLVPGLATVTEPAFAMQNFNEYLREQANTIIKCS